MNKGALVVYGWAAFNALLTVVLVVYSYRDPFPLIVYSGALVLIGTFGTAVLLVGRDQLVPGSYRMATRSTSAAFLAAALALIGLGTIYGLWIMLFALYPLLLAVVLVRRERVIPGAATDKEPHGDTATVTTRRARSVGVAVGVLAVGGQAVAVVRRALRRRPYRR
jgi:hypothetical protein